MSNNTNQKLAAAGMAAAVLLALAGWYAWFQAGKANADLQEKNTRLETQLGEALKRKELDNEVFTLLRDSDTRKIMLMDGKYTHAAIYLNEPREKALLDLNAMMAPPEGKYLKLWATTGKNSVDMGQITLMAPGGWQIFPLAPGVETFSVSQEDTPQGGTYPALVVLTGNAK